MNILTEKSLLLASNLLATRRAGRNSGKELSLLSAVICIIDVFGVFPIVTLSKSVIECGIYGIFVIIPILFLQMYTAVLLGRTWTLVLSMNYDSSLNIRCPYSTLADVSFGGVFGKVTSALLYLTVFFSGIPNLLVASQNFQLLMIRLTSPDDQLLHVSYCYWLIIIGVVLSPILCIGGPKDLRLVCGISAIMVLLVFVLLCIAINHDPVPLTGDVAGMLSFKNFLTIYSLLVFQLDVHPTILTIQMDMKNKMDLTRAIIFGFFATIIMVVVVTIFAKNTYGFDVKSSLLETVSPTIYAHAAALLVSMQLCLSSAIGNCALYDSLEHYMKIPRGFTIRRCVLRITLIVFGILLAESVPKFDIVMSAIGGTLTGPLVFILPPLFYLKIKKLQLVNNSREPVGLISAHDVEDDNADVAVMQVDVKESLENMCCIFIIAFGVCATIITTLVYVKEIFAYSMDSKLCILDIVADISNLL